MMWRFGYTRSISKKRNTLSLGYYPELSLAKARELREQYRAMIAQNIDPQEQKENIVNAEREKRENTFEAIAELYKSKEKLAPGTMVRNERIYQKLYREIGKMAITDIKAKHLIKAIEKEEAKGYVENALRLRSKASQVFRFAVKRGLCERDIAADLAGTIRSGWYHYKERNQTLCSFD
ncbi:hypothetical protein GCM10027155_09440 [Acinetobacter apis]|nr:integrase arm-type DNA-binding domain-containing protein [Acinetobacter apis]